MPPLPEPLWRGLLRLAPDLATRGSPEHLGLGDARLGELGEALAARAFQRAGWSIAARRLRTRWAEVDLVVRAAERSVCVEVKTARWRLPVGVRGERRAPPPTDLRWRPGGRLDAPTLARLRRAARALDPGGRGRVDLVEVWVAVGRGRSYLLHHPDLRRPLEG